VRHAPANALHLWLHEGCLHASTMVCWQVAHRDITGVLWFIWWTHTLCYVPLPAARPQPRPSGGIAPKNTTVYVGKIAPTLDDSVVQQLLQACGPTKSWKRMTVRHSVSSSGVLVPEGFALLVSKVLVTVQRLLLISSSLHNLLQMMKYRGRLRPAQLWQLGALYDTLLCCSCQTRNQSPIAPNDMPLCCRQDPETNQPKGFGFCEFEDAEGVMRALAHLNNLSVDGSELLVKCNAATQKYIDDYKARKVCFRS
jgi:RNA recognition motif-containing protein